MEPMDFEGVNVIIGAPPGWDKEKHGTCAGLPIMQRDGVCVSMWSLSWKERFQVLFMGRVVCHVASGSTQPPVALTVGV